MSSKNNQNSLDKLPFPGRAQQVTTANAVVANDTIVLSNDIKAKYNDLVVRFNKLLMVLNENIK